MVSRGGASNRSTYRDTGTRPLIGEFESLGLVEGKWKLAGNQAPGLDLPFEYSIPPGGSRLEAPTADGHPGYISLGPYGAHFLPSTGDPAGEAKANLTGFLVKDDSEMEELVGNGNGVRDPGETWGYPIGGDLSGDRVRLRRPVFTAPGAAVVGKVIYNKGPTGVYFDDEPHWIVLVGFEGDVRMSFGHVGKTAAAYNPANCHSASVSHLVIRDLTPPPFAWTMPDATMANTEQVSLPPFFPGSKISAVEIWGGLIADVGDRPDRSNSTIFLLIDDLTFTQTGLVPQDRLPPVITRLTVQSTTSVISLPVDIRVDEQGPIEIARLATVDLRVEHEGGTVLLEFGDGNLCGSASVGHCPTLLYLSTDNFTVELDSSLTGDYTLTVRACDVHIYFDMTLPRCTAGRWFYLPG